MPTDRQGAREVKPAAYWGPIGRKLPLLITGLLAGVVVVFTAAAYHAFERALFAAAGERVVKVSQRIALALADPEIRLRRDGSALTRDTTLRQVLERPSPATRSRAQALLEAEKARNPAARLVELLSASGARTLAAGEFRGALGTADSTAPAIARTVIGRLHAAHDSVYTEVRLPIIGSNHDTVGVMREVSLIAGERTGPLMRALIGGNAILLVTNATGDLWTDMHRPTPGPALARGREIEGVPIATHNPDGSRWIGALAPVPRVPWGVWVALPESAVLAPARPLLYEVAAMALIVLVLGAILARAVSQHIVGAVGSVTEAAEALAAGDYSRRATVIRNDEIGRLAGSFNRMAAEIQEASLDLGNQAAELEAQQTELEESNEELRTAAAAAKAARDDAEESRQRTTAVIAGALDCIITLDRGCKILDFNPAAERTFGYATAEIVGRPVTDIFARDGTDDGQCGVLESYLNADDDDMVGSRMQLTALRSGGQPFAVDVAINRVPMNGPPMFTCFVRDLSAEKQLESELRQSQKMEAVGNLAGGVAHDFNNILTVISSYTQLLLSDKALPESMRGDVGEVRLAADRAAALTRQLLAFSRKQVLHPAMVDINDVVAHMSAMLARLIREDVRLEVKLGVSVNPVFVDRGQLEQIIMNLAVNARDAMPGGGALVVETSNVELDTQYGALHAGAKPGPHVVLSVTDTGVGMDAATRARVFEPFFTTKDVSRGTGLGLSTVYGIVKQSGGSIYVYSETGRGTTFKIYFPRYKGAVADAQEAPELTPVPAPPGATVLLVEDDASVRAAVRSMLQRIGYEVLEVPSGAAALDRIRANGTRLDAVLSDAMMPGMSGVELATVLEAEYPGLPVLIMSGYTEDAVARGGSLTPTTLFVEKPFTVQVLSAALADALAQSGKRAVQPALL